eukprot:2856-Heterococcus_DN1.PRE.3
MFASYYYHCFSTNFNKLSSVCVRAHTLSEGCHVWTVMGLYSSTNAGLMLLTLLRLPQSAACGCLKAYSNAFDTATTLSVIIDRCQQWQNRKARESSQKTVVKETCSFCRSENTTYPYETRGVYEVQTLKSAALRLL